MEIFSVSINEIVTEINMQTDNFQAMRERNFHYNSEVCLVMTCVGPGQGKFENSSRRPTYGRLFSVADKAWNFDLIVESACFVTFQLIFMGGKIIYAQI